VGVETIAMAPGNALVDHDRRASEMSAVEGHRRIWRSWLANGVDGRTVSRHLWERRPFLRILHRVARELGSGGRVRTLEMGCGSGLDSALLAACLSADRASGVSVDAVVSDVVPEAIGVAESAATLLGVKTTGIVADAARMPFADESFDLVFHHGLLEHFRDPGEIARETGRLVRQGGMAVVVVPQRYTGYTLFKRWKMRRGTWAHGWEREYSLSELLDLFSPLGFKPRLATGYDTFAASAGRVLAESLHGLGPVGRRIARLVEAVPRMYEALLPLRLRPRLMKNLVLVLRRCDSATKPKQCATQNAEQAHGNSRPGRRQAEGRYCPQAGRRRLRLLFVGNVPSPYQVELFGGIARRGLAEVRALFCMWSYPGRGWARAPLPHGFEVLPGLSAQHILPDLTFSFGLDKRIAAFDPDVAIVGSYMVPGLHRAMGILSRRRTPWLYWEEYHRFSADPVKRTIRRRLLHGALRGCDGVLAIGTRAREFFRHIVGDAREVHDFPYASDLGRFKGVAGGQAHGVVRPALTGVAGGQAHWVVRPALTGVERKLEDGRTRFLYSGQLIERKGVDVLLDAFARVAAAQAGAELVILGDGPRRARLEASVPTEILERVRFLGDVPWTDLPGHYAEADVFVFPSRHDGWGLVVPEAMAAGLPVISTPRVGSALDLVKEGETGFLVKTDDAGALADRMSYFSERPEEAARMGERARKEAMRLDLREAGPRLVDIVGGYRNRKPLIAAAGVRRGRRSDSPGCTACPNGRLPVRAVARTQTGGRTGIPGSTAGAHSGAAMSVVFFLEQAVGGAERVALEYASWLAGRGWRVDVVAGGTLDDRARKAWREWGGGLSATEISWRGRTEYRFPVILPSLDGGQNSGLERVIRDIRPDIVVINQPGPDSAQGAIRAALSIPGGPRVVPLVHLAAARQLRMRLRRIKLWWARRLYAQVDRVFSVSRASARSLREDYGVPEELLEVLPNGIRDGRAWNPREVARSRLRLGLSPTDVAVLWAGRFTQEKGVDLLLSAAERLGSRPTKVRFLLAGDGPLRVSLEGRFAKTIASGRATLLGWRDDVARLLRMCDIATMPSRLECFGLFIAEAMAAGKPVVATRVHGIPDVVRDGETGILVPPEDPAALAWAVERLAADRGAREAMGRAGRRRYEAEFTFETAATRFERALRAVVAGRASLERTA